MIIETGRLWASTCRPKFFEGAKDEMFKKNPLYSLAPKGAHPGYDGEGAGAGTGGNSGGNNGEIDPNVARYINSTVNGALTNFRTKDLPKVVNDTVAPLLNPLSESLTGIREALKIGGEGGNGGAPQGGNQGHNQGGGQGGLNLPPEVNARLKDLESTIKNQGTALQTLQQQKDEADKRAERAERHGLIREAMSKIQFADEKAAGTGFMLVEPHIKRSDDGSVIADGNLPVDRFIDEFFKNEHSYLLPNTGATGSGASPQGASRGAGGLERADINDIRPGMSEDTRKRVLQSIGSVMPQRNSNR